VDEGEWLAGRFEHHRSKLRAVALRMLGSASEADDAVQEAWLRLSRSDVSDVQHLGRWLTTVVGRICLDMLLIVLGSVTATVRGRLRKAWFGPY
jgi:DNA-directed RNA polymerase specialized sigma24 family protein